MLSPVQVLDILAKRMDDRADCLERVNMPDGYAVTIAELRNFATMVRRARAYLTEGAK